MTPGLAVSRRNFLAAAGGVVVASAVGQGTAFAGRPQRKPSLGGGRFTEGVISGDPTPKGITLWTRVSDVEGAGTVELEVARDRGFRKVVARELVKTSGRIDHSVKARVGGLRAHEQYFYRFSTRGENSPVGRFRTALPPDSRQPVRFAFFSCQDYTFGYFNAHNLLAEEDIDFVVNLGDYIYAEAYYQPGDAFAGVRVDPVGYSETLEQYRAKYKLYRTEASLRRVHANFPMISIWDDHEVQDNYAGGAGPDRRAHARAALHAAAEGGGLPRVLREHADVSGRRRPRPHLHRAPLRAHRGPDPARSAPVPRRSALRRRVRSVRPARTSNSRASSWARASSAS